MGLLIMLFLGASALGGLAGSGSEVAAAEGGCDGRAECRSCRHTYLYHRFFHPMWVGHPCPHCGAEIVPEGAW